MMPINSRNVLKRLSKFSYKILEILNFKKIKNTEILRSFCRSRKLVRLGNPCEKALAWPGSARSQISQSRLQCAKSLNPT